MTKNEWISPKEKLPDFDVDVLIYYEIESKTTTYKYIEIASVTSITQGKDYKNAEWKDKEYNSKEPLMWMPFPDYPSTNNLNRK